jgi:hypothetical protein
MGLTTPHRAPRCVIAAKQRLLPVYFATVDARVTRALTMQVLVAAKAGRLMRA